MDKIYFACSDLHSCFIPFKDALWRAGFRKTNPAHHLIICGDIFDRGDDTLEIYKFIKSIPKSRRTLIKGNHEYLLLQMLDKTFPDSYDFSNGTVKTLCHIADLKPYIFDKGRRGEEHLRYLSDEGASLYQTWRFAVNKANVSPIIKWLRSSEWVDFFEVNKYIFTHSFIPLHIKEQYRKYDYSVLAEECFEFNENWRTESSGSEIECATWGCPYLKFDAGLFAPEVKNGKVLVCGHWWAFDFHTYYNKKMWIRDHNIYYSDHLIALDACTPSSLQVNVLVIKDGVCYDKLGGAELKPYARPYPKIETVPAL